MVYYVFAAIATLFAYVYTKNRKRYKRSSKVFYFLSFLTYFIPAAIRYGIGQDYFYTYYPMFHSIRNGAYSIYTNMIIRYNEYGFTVFNKIVGFFTSDAQWIFVLTSLFCVGMAFKCIKDYSPNIPFSVFMLVLGSYYVGSYSLIRQSIATVIFLFSIRYIKERKVIKYYICTIIAILFHTAAIVYIPFYFIGNIKMEKKKYPFVAAVVVVVLMLSSTVVSYFVSMTRFVDRISSVSVGDNLALYLMVVLVFFVGLLGYTNEKDELYRVFLNAQLIAVCIIGLSNLLQTTDRLIFTYYYINFVSIPYFLKNGKFGRIRQFVVLGLIVALFAMWCFEHLYYDQYSILPYRTIFSR